MFVPARVYIRGEFAGESQGVLVGLAGVIRIAELVVVVLNWVIEILVIICLLGVFV